MQTAAELKIQKLYRYQPFNFEWLYQTIFENIIFLSSPETFNDPWDCRLYFADVPDDPGFIDAVCKYPDRTFTREQVETAAREKPEFLKKLINDISLGTERKMHSLFRICCLAARPDCSLMWGHYARGHTGICLEFNATHNQVFSSALKVKYETSLLAHKISDRSTEGNISPFITKSNDWAYEEEYRLIAQDQYVDPNACETLLTKGNLLNIPENSLSAVILGCRMDESNKEKIRNLIKKSEKPIQVKEAYRLPHKYGLEIK